MNANERIIAAVDLGTSKISLAVANVDGDNIQVLFYRAVPSAGIRSSAIFNPKKAEAVLSELLKSAEDELKIKILTVAVGLPRAGVRQEKAEAVCQRTTPDDCITWEEIESLKSLAKDEHSISSPERDVIYDAVAQCFSTPEYFQVSENDIEGMISSEITGHFNLFIGRKSHINNLYKVFNDLCVAVARMYFSPVATARAVLSDEELQNGVALIDMGGGVTSVSIYRNRVLVHYASIPFGGNVVTSDIRNECSISDSLAENIKCAFGGCMSDRLQTLGEKIIQVEGDDMNITNQIPVSYLADIISAREKEIIDAMLYSISESGLANHLRKGIVITGGGAEMLNLGNYIRELSGYTVRVAYPRGGFVATGCEEILKCSAVTAAGMIMLAKEDNLNCCTPAEEETPAAQIGDTGVPNPFVNEDAGQQEAETVENAETPSDIVTPEENGGKDDGGSSDEGNEEPKQEKKKKRSFFKTIAWSLNNYYDNLSKEKV